MKAYLINLDRSPERLAHFTKRAKKVGITFERIAAVDGRTLSLTDQNKLIADSYTFQPINAAEIGLFLSHRTVWQKVVDHKIACAAVFEDDVVLAKETGSLLTTLETVAAEYDVIKLETTLRKVIVSRKAHDIQPGFRLHDLLSWHGGTAGYVVSLKGAEQLLRQSIKLADPVDQVIFNPLSPVFAKLRIGQLDPAPCIQMVIYNKDAGASIFGTTIDRPTTRRSLFRHGPAIDIKRTWLKYIERRRRRKLVVMSANIEVVPQFADKDVT